MPFLTANGPSRGLKGVSSLLVFGIIGGHGEWAMSRRLRTILPLFAIVAMAALVALFVCRTVDRTYRGRLQEKKETTWHILSNLRMSLVFYEQHYGRLPGPTLSDAISRLEKEGHRVGFDYYEEIRTCKKLKRGCDAWNRPLVYELRDPTHSILRSVGANGVDEKGAGDDIQIEVEEP
jgi:hypothetical protein